MKVIFDMETADPDDVMTLCFLTSHPKIELVAVTVTPGSFDQVALVKHALELTDHAHVPVGARLAPYEKQCVSAFHHKWLGLTGDQEPDEGACRLLQQTIEKHPDVTLLTGAPLKNIGRAFGENSEIQLKQWVAQGGFAGDNLVAEEHRLDKFKGMITCPTFNFNGDPKSALMLLSTNQISKRFCVSKNVCHGNPYDQEMHEKVRPHKDKTPGLELIYKGMELYLKKKPKGKLFHDPLAATTIINKDICKFVEVELYREKGKWGSRAKSGTNTFISVSLDREKFVDTLVETDEILND